MTQTQPPQPDDDAQRLLQVTGRYAPGCALIYLDRDQQGLAVAGERARGSGVAIQPDDLWHIGSNTKAMTATLVARLAEAGLVSLQDRLGDVLGAHLPDLHPDYAGATYAALLSHRAGVPPEPSLALRIKLMDTDIGRDTVTDRLTILSQVLAKPRKNAAFVYSNSSYMAATAMVEATTGEPWESLIRDHVFAPLGMDSAGFGPPGVAEDLSQPRGHTRAWFRLKPVEPGPWADNVPAYGPAGRVHVTAGDQMQFLQAHMTKDPGFLSPASWDWLHRPAAGAEYVAGWGREGTALFHAGSNTFWYNTVAFDPTQDRAIAVFANAATRRVISAVDQTVRGFMRPD